MLPPQPQFSFPIPQNFTFHGSSRPFFRLRLAIGLSPSKVMYSIHLDISSTVPLPTFPLIKGSVPNCSHRSRNSCVPKLLSSTTPPQWVLIILGRSSRGPMPSIQWYSSAKHPPGQRKLGMLMSYNACTTSSRIPRVFGIEESSPTQYPP